MITAIRVRALAATALLGVVELAFPCGAEPLARSTLTRFHDPVIVPTSELGVLPNRRTDHLRLFALHAGALEPIPFQIDAFDESHDLVTIHGEAPREFDFDDDDELVFMAKDAGDAAPVDAFPPDADVVLEIRVDDPVSAERGWAYLAHFASDAPAASPISYARYDTATDVARGRLYAIQYYPGLNFFTGMRFVSADGTEGDNVLHRMKIRLNPTFKWGWSPVFKEDDFSAEVEAVKNGPVRSIRRVRQQLMLGPFLPRSGGIVYTYYYFSSFVTPTYFSFPWMVLKALKDFRFTGVSDFNAGALGMKYWDAANPEGLRFTGHNQIPVNAETDHDWWALGGPSGSCVHIFMLPKELTDAGIVRGTIFVDNATAVDSEDSDPVTGEHAVGYSLLNVVEAGRAGSFETMMATVFLPEPYRPGAEEGALAMMNQPLRASVEPLERKGGKAHAIEQGKNVAR